MSESVLRFEQVTIEGGRPYDSAIWQVSFDLLAGQLLLVHLESQHPRLPIADAAQGLIEPIEGRVQFFENDWRDLPPRQTAEARTRIGRVFDEPAWLSEIDLDDNITLAQRHHTQRAESEIRDDAAELARAFSLPGLPSGHSSSTRVQDLRRSACIRAFISRPELIILERPTAGVYPEIMPPLMANLRSARTRGAAVLWLTESWEVWNDRGIRPTLRATMSGSQMSMRPTE